MQKMEQEIENELATEEEPETSKRGVIDDDDDDFEFTFEGIAHDSDWFPSDDHVFPIFDRRLLSESDATAIKNDEMQTGKSAMKKLFILDDHNQHDEDELLQGSYCVWTPGNSPQASPARCKKSSSTGTIVSRWGVGSLKELLIRRSRSDGKRSLVRFGKWNKKSENVVEKEAVVLRKDKVVKSGGEEKRWTTYLPYKKAIIGFGYYPSVNGFGGVKRDRPPF